MNLTIAQVIEATGGVFYSADSKEASIGYNCNESSPGLSDEGFFEISIKSISTDSRNIQKDALFVPIVGERFDGHDFIGQAVNLGALCVLTEKKLEGSQPYILVKCTRQALLDIASFYITLFDVRVVGLTGSAGKTTTKDMIASVLAKKYRTKKTIGNFNNDIGMPLSIFTLEEGDEVIVLEMGMNHAGEIRKLTYAAKPDVAIITNIGDAHIENFKNRTGILHAKLEIVEGLKKDGSVFLNGDDPLLTGEIAAKKTEGLRVFMPGKENIKNVKPMGLSGSECRFSIGGQDVNVAVPLPGSHMVANALLASAVCLFLGVSPGDITRGFEDYMPTEGRLNVVRAKNRTIISDVYNASPDSVKNALQVLSKECGRKVAILGDMLELGSFAKARHEEVGSYAAELGIDVLVAVGDLAKYFYEGFASYVVPGRNLYIFPTKGDFFVEIDEILLDDDVVLVKASRGAKFEEITERLI